MRAGDSKLRALQKKIALQEEQLMLERNRIDYVVQTRTELVAQLGRETQTLEQRLVELRTTKRKDALSTGDGSALAGLSAFAVRLGRELEAVGVKAKSAEKDLKSAVDRLELADAELVALRVEKKRIEKLLDSRELSERVQSVAREEAMTDEMNTYRRSKRED